MKRSHLGSLLFLSPLLLMVVLLTSFTQRNTNLYDAFRQIKKEFPERDIINICTDGFNASYGEESRLQYPDGSIKNPTIRSDLREELIKQSDLFEGHGHLFSFSQFNESIIQVIIAVPGHYSTPSAIMLLINKNGKIVSEVMVSSVFFDAGMGRVTRSLLIGRNSLEIIHKDLDERPDEQCCKAEIKKYIILETGELKLNCTDQIEIECKV